MGPTAQFLKIRASLFLAFSTPYTTYFAKKLTKKLKPKIGKTKTFGNFQISDLETKSFVKLKENKLSRLIITGTTNESNEFFQIPSKVTQLINTESDSLNDRIRAAFDTDSFLGNLTTVDIDDMSWLEARYKYYFADIYFVEGKLVLEIYIQTVHEDDIQLLNSALQDVQTYDIETMKIIEESKLNSSSCSGLYLLSKVRISKRFLSQG